MKIGKIEFSQDLIQDMIEGKLSEATKNIFSKIIPVRIEENFIKRLNTYTCYCDEFEDIDEGKEIPCYDLIISELCLDGKSHITNIKIKKKNDFIVIKANENINNIVAEQIRKQENILGGVE